MTPVPTATNLTLTGICQPASAFQVSSILLLNAKGNQYGIAILYKIAFGMVQSVSVTRVMFRRLGNAHPNLSIQLEMTKNQMKFSKKI